MRTAAPYLVSTLIGFLVLKIFFRQISRENFSLYLFLSPGLGLGISSLITFFSFIVCDKFDPLAIWILHAIALMGLGIIHVRLKNFQDFRFQCPCIKPFDVLCLMLLGLTVALVYLFGRAHPFGEWDGWALWNMKAKFLTLSGISWRGVCHELHWHTQPDYPLLLPLMNVWGWSLSYGNFSPAPFWTAFVFSVSCAGLLFTGLERFIERKIALFAACFLISLFPYHYIGTAQYADIILSYYLLAGMVTLTVALRHREHSLLFLFGIFLGLMTFTKNEGTVIALLLIILTAHHLWRENSVGALKSSPLLLKVLAGFLITASFTLYFKLFLAPPNRDIIMPADGRWPYFNFEGCYLILTAFLHELTGVWSHPAWVAGLAIVINVKKLFHKEIRIMTLFFILYALVLFFIYLTTSNFNLTWRLSRTSSRIICYLLPSVLFWIFYMTQSPDDKSKANI